MKNGAVKVATEMLMSDLNDNARRTTPTSASPMARPKKDEVEEGVVFEKRRVDSKKRTTIAAPKETALNVVIDDAV
jgi:hypothetical protein